MRAWVLLALAGCTAATNKCKDKTLFVSVTLQGAAQDADHILVDVSVDGGAPVHTDLPHTAGKTMGAVEIDFPNGYPKGRSIAVTLTATLASATVATGSGSVTLKNSCDTLTLVVSPTSSSDLSSADQAGVDLAGLDFSGVDLTTVDIATIPDLQRPDLTTFVDLLNCMPQTENCFNNTDDDCDGLIDCADPDCTGGGSPIATCVPDPGSFAPGTLLSGASICPTEWPTLTTLNSNLTSSCNKGSCSGCTLNDAYCVGEFASSSDPSCGSGRTNYIHPRTGACTTNSFTINNGDYHTPTIGVQATWDCGAATGTATKGSADWGNSQHFCSRPSVGSGCTLGSICVPAASNHCVMKVGSQIACPSSYALDTTRYYTGFDDSARACTCYCGQSNSLSCSGAPGIDLYPLAGCSGSIVQLATTCTNDDISSYHYANLGEMVVVGTASCYATTQNHPQDTVLLDERTVCCTP